MRHWLLHKLRKSSQIEPALPGIISQEFLLTRFRNRETELLLASALGLQLKTGCARQIGLRDPKLVRLFIRAAEFCRYIVIHDRGMCLFRCC